MMQGGGMRPGIIILREGTDTSQVCHAYRRTITAAAEANALHFPSVSLFANALIVP